MGRVRMAYYSSPARSIQAKRPPFLQPLFSGIFLNPLGIPKEYFSRFSEIVLRGEEGTGKEEIFEPRDWRDTSQGQDA
ncbi:Sigma-54 interaction domain, ATP-binding site [Trema orientale]|uniref:Sigma-54 interaction domain, ATP-binding site n=1 Tax=Trema orientale TaxID=63057 RepID=A0A2P5FU34_TREOI|nr:Sigma-54 interaction domain, ATP-binding site [Trema orientale]